MRLREGNVAVATLVMFGIYGLLGNHLNMVTSVLPIVVMVLGIADAVIVFAYPDASADHQRRMSAFIVDTATRPY